jgi:hypothetical protein
VIAGAMGLGKGLANPVGSGKAAEIAAARHGAGDKECHRMLWCLALRETCNRAKQHRKNCRNDNSRAHDGVPSRDEH